MADTKISALPAASALGGTEVAPVVQSAATVKATIAQIKDYILGQANTFTATQTITPAANTEALTISGASLTGSNASSFASIAGTWNTSGAPSAFLVNITNTASGAGLLANLQIGSDTRFKVSKLGRFDFGSATAGTGGTAATGDATAMAWSATGSNTAALVSSNGSVGFQVGGGSSFTLLSSGGCNILHSATGIQIDSSGGFGNVARLSGGIAANMLQLGAANAASPVGGGITAQGSRSGTDTNVAGANLTVRSGIGTGDATASKLLLQVPLPVASGTGAQTSTTAISINNSTATGLQFNGYGAGAITADASGNLTAVSDPSMKHIQRSFTPGLAELSRIKPIIYKWREDSGMEPDNEYAGFDAQNVRDAIEMATWKGKGGLLSLQDRALLAACVNAINELASRAHA